MLKIVELDSWLDFEKIMQGQLLRETEAHLSGRWVYRGHSDATWHLETTLERATKSHLTVQSYFNIIIIKDIQTNIETFTDRKWDLPNYEDFYSALKEHLSYQNDQVFIYMTYLRHFGFPSPLLDWSKSPFVAAYFAFRDASSTAKSIAIYDFYIITNEAENSVMDVPRIFPIYASPRKNKRHELQQGFYTICLREIDDRIYYDNHEHPDMLAEDRGEYITKYILPASERVKALHSLEAYNINAYSLFGTEESLLETLFLRTYKRANISKNYFGKDNDGVWDWA